MKSTEDGSSGLPIPIAIGALLALAWTSILLPGFAFPWSNNVFHIPIVLDYAASFEGPHDAFTRSLDNFVSSFWPTLGLFTNESNIFLVFFFVHLVGRFVFVLGIYGIARHFRASQIAALAMAGLGSIAPIFKGVSTVGHTETLATYLSHTGFAVAAMPACWWLLLRRRWILGAAAIGLIFNVNAFMSIWSAVAAIAAIFVSRATTPKFWQTLIRCALAYVIFALPTIMWILSTVTESAAPIDFRAFLLFRSPYHTFVHVQWDAFGLYMTYLLAAGLAVWAAMRALGEDALVMTALIAAYIAIFLFGVLLPYITDSRLLLNLYPLRIDAAINVAVAAITLGWAARKLTDDEPDTLPMALSFSLLAGNTVAALLVAHALSKRAEDAFLAKMSIVAVVAIVVFLLAMGLSPGFDDLFVPLALIFSICALAGVVGDRDNGRNAAILIPVTASFCWMFIGAGGKLGMLGAAAIALVGVGIALFELDVRLRVARIALSPSVVLIGLSVIGATLSTYAVWRGSVERPDAEFASEREAQRWFRNATPRDTQFLPVEVNGFSVLSRRPAWVDHQAGAAVMWKPDFLTEWKPRIVELTACKQTACFALLARKHGIPWIVALNGRLHDWDAVGLRLRFTNKRYQIFSVDPDIPNQPIAEKEGA